MKPSTAIDIALKYLDEAARVKYQAWVMYSQGWENQKNQADEYTRIREAMKIIKNLGQQEGWNYDTVVTYNAS